MMTLPASFALRFCSLCCGSNELLKMPTSTPCIPMNELSLLYNEDKSNMQRKLRSRESARHDASWCYRNLGFIASAVSSIPSVKTDQASSKYCFRIMNGGQVKVSVGMNNAKYLVNIEASSLHLGGDDDKLFLCWGIYRSDASSFMPLDFYISNQDPKDMMFETPFMVKSFGTYGIEMEFESYLAPFYISFLLKYPSAGLELKSHRNTKFCVPVGFGSGCSFPLGISFSSDGSINFALSSRNCTSVSLCMYDDCNSEKPALEIELDPYVNRTGDIWHASFDGVGPYVSYGYRCKGPSPPGRGGHVIEKVHLDPYANVIGKSVSGHRHLGKLCAAPAFDWGDDVSPSIPMENLVVYRLNVMQFTIDKSSKVPHNIAGTFLGVIEKMQHLKDLGVNAILLEPVFSFDEKKGAYFPLHFFSPANTYGPSGTAESTINSLKEMIKKMHSSGIEVYLEVVFTHTSDVASLQGIDYSSYYLTHGNPGFGDVNYLNCNYPVVQQLIVDSLRYWVAEFHIDGFCFVNASGLLRGFHGESLSRPPLVEAIAFDPLLSKTKIIADCWDPCDLTSKEINFSHWKRWAEINSKFCSDVRNFLRGEGLLSDLATRLCGSGDVFSEGRGPAFSFNFIARNFGLPLVDLVSFSSPDVASELSWNCGKEGPTSDKVVLERRLKQIRNFLFVLFISLGIPVLNMGDECGQSSKGSPAYLNRTPFNWSALSSAFGVQTTQFISYLTSLRKRRSDLLQKRNFLSPENISWYGNDLSPPRWDDPTATFLAMALKAETNEVELSSSSSSCTGGDLYVAFNSADHSEDITLPPSPEGMAWECLVDTALPYPGFFSAESEPITEPMPGLVSYEMKAFSCLLLEARAMSD